MNSSQVLAHIRETNLSYLELARRLIAANRPNALLQLGITDASASMLADMTPLQMMKVCAGT